MSGKTIKQAPHERRRGEAALSEFAEYVERQQSLRYPSSVTASTVTTTSGSTTEPSIAETDDTEHHAELDDFLDALNLSETTAPRLRLRDLLLCAPDDKASLSRLAEVLRERIVAEHGEFVFELGFEDGGGGSLHLTRAEWDTALDRLQATARLVSAECQLLLTKGVGGPLEAESSTGKEKECTGKVLVRQAPATVEQVIETRIAVVGNVDAGKSSMLGVLVKGDLDDGRGRARVNLFRHKHEIETGRTSSVGMEIMGFDTTGNVITSDTPGHLAGHERYLRTTVFGMLSSSPNYCLLMVAANNGLIGMSKEHLGIALALNVPVLVVITKIDICPPNILEQTITQITRILKSPGAQKVPVFIKNREQCVSTATQLVSKRICPIFQVSNVTGENLDLVRMFLNILPHYGRYDQGARFEFHVNDTFSVPFVGTVVSGIVKSGVVHAGDSVLVGPDSLGNFTPTSIRSIERKRIGVPAASAGQSASFALKKVKRKDVRKGMVVLPKIEGEAPPKVYREFVAEVLILSHATTIKTKYQAMLHVGPVSQTCAIIDVDRPFIRTGDRAQVAFRFVQRPEYLAPGDRLLFREGRTKGLGIVKSVGYDPKHPLGGRPVDDDVPAAGQEGAAVASTTEEAPRVESATA
ncbi:GTP-binding protein 1 [Pyricularia oryzae Y34]|uniref:GTP-binding protein 1 n=2 Tax=Pyricularia oryzae TaxID=318829 RepID=A0AA97P701_PYRO3|nr:GTP-binding protein 1 [Pyricularia oryzae Y34]